MVLVGVLLPAVTAPRVSPTIASSATPEYTAPSPEAAIDTPRCTDGTPVYTVSQDAAAGTRYMFFTVRNCADTPLAMTNPPEVSVTNGRGEQTRVPLRDGASAFRPRTVPGHGVAVLLLTYRGGGSSEDPDGRALRLTIDIHDVGTMTMLQFTDLAADSDPKFQAFYATENAAAQGS